MVNVKVITSFQHSTSIRYWPEKDKTEIYENISVTNMKEETFANFVCRELSVKKVCIRHDFNYFPASKDDFCRLHVLVYLCSWQL